MTNPIGSALSGIGAANAWLNAAADDIANADDVGPTTGQVHRTQYVQTAPSPSGGVTVTGIAHGPNGVVVPEPSSPLADASGNVRLADVDLVQQVSEMLGVERAVQANAVSIDRAADAFRSLLAAGGDQSSIETQA
jgi:flagellar basal-body rod protein FlgC